MINNTDVVPKYLEFQLPSEVTIQSIAQLATSYIEYKGQKEIWAERISKMEKEFEKHGQSEIRTIEIRRLEAEIARISIEAARGLDDSSAVVQIFKKFMDSTPDLLSHVVNIIKSQNRSS